MDNTRACLVCSTPITSLHLGMDICRACAAFFKRAKMTGVQYPCRQGTRQCELSDDKLMCRRCRFDRCLSVGIVYDGPMRLRAKPANSLLERIAKEFKYSVKAMIERCKRREIKYLKSYGQKAVLPHPRETIYVVNLGISVDIEEIAASESMVFFDNSFPLLKMLPDTDKFGTQYLAVLKEYIPKLSLIVRYYLTRQLWGDVRKKLMCSIITCYDTEVPMDFYYPEGHGNKDFFESCLRSYVDDHERIFLPQFDRAQLTITEFHALTAIVLTEHELSLSDESQEAIDGVRKEILENLQSYYRNELGLIDFSVRLGHLLSVNHTIQECQAAFKVAIGLFSTVFNLHLTEKMMETMSL